MKKLNQWLCVCSIALCGTTNLRAAAVVIDSFTEGSFEFAGSPAGSPISSFSPIASPVVGGRGVVVRGGGDRILSLIPSDGFMHYDVSAAAFAPIGQQFTLTYYAAAGQIINLLGQNAFLFTFSSVTGQGDIEFGINSSLSPYRLTTAGEVLWPYSHFPTESTLTSFSITFVARSADFSFNLDEIALIPEPTSLAFSSVALLGLIARRRRP